MTDPVLVMRVLFSLQVSITVQKDIEYKKYMFLCLQFLDLHKVTAAPPPTELKYPVVVMRSHQMVVSYSLLDQMMMMMIVLGWKISKSKVVVLEEGGVEVDLEEGVAEVDVGLPVKQCVEWVLGKAMGGIQWNHTGSAHTKWPMAKKI